MRVTHISDHILPEISMFSASGTGKIVLCMLEYILRVIFKYIKAFEISSMKIN